MMIQEKYKPYSKYKPSGIEWIGEIPERWEEKRIDWVMDYLRETSRIGEMKGYEVFHYSIPIIQETGDGQVQDVDEISSDKLALTGGELLVSKLNPRKGMVLISKKKEIPVVCSSEFVPLVPRNINLKFSFYLFCSTVIRERLSSTVQSATYSHQRARPRDITKLWFYMPPFPQQQAIADFLDRETLRINSIVEKQTRMIELLKEKRSALIAQTVTKGLDKKERMKDSGVEWIGEIPEGWEIRKGKWIFNIFNSADVNIDNISTDDGDIHYLKVDDLNYSEGAFITTSNLKYSSSLNKFYSELPVLVFPKRGAAIFTNKICICNLPYMLDSNLMAVSLSKFCEAKYFYYQIQSRKLEDIADVSSVPQINNKHIKPLVLVVPPIPAQRAIADFLDRETAKIDTLIGKIEKRIELLDEYKQSLITHAVTGKILKGGVTAERVAG
jgi:type I restriction enzyme, S subunit